MNAPETPDTHRLIGAAVKRKEDYRFLTGNGQYTDDVVLPQQTFGVFLRSPYAHATIRSIDITAAKAAPGVVAIFTGADMAGESVGGLPCGWLIHNIDGKPMNEPPHPVIAHTKVRHVGDQVALIVAESVKEAKDAIELIEVDYDVLPAVVDTATAADPGQPQVHDEAPNNLCYTGATATRPPPTPPSPKPRT
jgi:carbon-monoxide dehydrogenase large subunit